jgi:hypothetical protein
MNHGPSSDLHQSMLHEFFKKTSDYPSVSSRNEASSEEALETSPMMRMLLLAPSNSFQIRSSLSMDVAYAMASELENSFEIDKNQNVDRNYAVGIILVPRHSHEIHSLLDFPFQCRPYSSTEVHLNSTTNNTHSRWNYNSLSRISVHQIDGIYHLIQTLASIHICDDDTKNDQTKVLIVQDIHEYIIEQNHHVKSENILKENGQPGDEEGTLRNKERDTNATSNKHLTTEELMRLNHILALITDACYAFDETCHLIVTCDTNLLPIDDHPHVKHMLFRHLNSITSVVEHEDKKQQNMQYGDISSLSQSSSFKIISSWNVRMEYDPWQDLALQQCAVKKNDVGHSVQHLSYGKLHLVSTIDQDYDNYNGRSNLNWEYGIPELLDNGGFGDDEKEIIWEISETA